MGSLSYDNELWTHDAPSTWALFTKSISKRLPSTNQSRKTDTIKSYNALKKYKDQSVNRYLYDWERVYGLAVAHKLPDVAEERPLYDFALAISPINEIFATY